MSDSLFDLWARRDPQWEKRYEDNIVKKFCDYGRGATSLREDRGKLFGSGYEIYIVAFFIGLYNNQRRQLVDDAKKRKSFGHPIQNWGNITASVANGRKPYPKLRKFIFIALIARADIDFIALEEGDIKPAKAVDMLVQLMEEYANWGFHFIEDKMEDDANYFFVKLLSSKSF